MTLPFDPATIPTNVYAHMPEVPKEGWYRLGDGLQESSEDLWFNTTLPDGTHIACAEPDGWEGLSFLTPIDQSGGRDGGLLGPPSVAPRELPVRGLMVAPTAQTLRLRIRDLRSRLRSRRLVVWDQYDFGVQRRMGLVCAAQGDFRATPVAGSQRGGVAVAFSFSLVAANPPWKFATGDASERCAGLPVSDVSGRTYDKLYDFTYGGIVNPGGRINATNAGDVDAWPIFTITGPVEYPIITNDTTGDQFIVTTEVAAGQEIQIDSRTGIVDPSSVRLVGRPFPLAPGVNTVRWRATSGSFTPEAQLCLTWRSTWE